MSLQTSTSSRGHTSNPSQHRVPRSPRRRRSRVLRSRCHHELRTRSRRAIRSFHSLSLRRLLAISHSGSNPWWCHQRSNDLEVDLSPQRTGGCSGHCRLVSVHTERISISRKPRFAPCFGAQAIRRDESGKSGYCRLCGAFTGHVGTCRCSGRGGSFIRMEVAVRHYSSGDFGCPLDRVPALGTQNHYQ
jgi:hypothetical protein